MVRMGLEVPQYEVGLLFDSRDPATLCIPGCNPMYPRLQRYVSQAATLCIPGCNPMYVSQAATPCDLLGGPAL